MKEKRSISRKQFLTGGATMALGAVLGKLSGHVYAEETPPDSVDAVSLSEKTWDQLLLDILLGAYLVSDSKSALFGGTRENAECCLSQYFHVYPGLELMLSDSNAAGEENGWVGYSKELRPIAMLRSGSKTPGSEKRALVTVPAGVYYLRGSSSREIGQPRAWVKSFAQYALNCGLGRPDLTDYTEITELTLNQNMRREVDGKFDTSSDQMPSMGDLFFTPIGTDIIVTFNNANIAPYIQCGENYMLLTRKNIFSRHYGFGYTWYHCKTTEICNCLGAYYEARFDCAKALSLAELQAAEPHLYIRFPSHVTHTIEAARIRTKGVKSNYERLFTVVHLTDTHGDADSTHAAFEYADQIKADFVALTGDYVPYRFYHGYNILHTIINNAKSPSVYTIGNHDAVGLSDQAVYATCYAPIKDTIHASEEHPYYFRDFPYGTEIVRAISLCPFSDKAAAQSYAYYSQEQLLWLCDVMASAPENAHIMILRHFPHHKPVLTYGAGDMFYDFSNNTDFGNLWLNMGNDPVIEIVDAYNKREQIFAQYSSNMKSGTEVVTIRYDFTNRPDSEFVAYFTGHIHNDIIGYAREAKTPQAVLGSLCTIGAKGTEEYYSYTSYTSHRDYGTDTQIAFNVFTFDFNNKKIYIACVGNGLFKDREKTWMEMSYE